MIQVVRSPLIAALVLLAIAAVIPALYFSYEIADLEYNITAARQAASQAKQARGIVDKSDQSIASFTAVALELSHEERASVLQETNRHLADLQEAFRYLEPLTKQVLTQSDFAELEERIASAQHHWEEIQEQANDGMGETEKTFHFLKIFKDTLFLRDVLTRVELFATAVAEDKTEKSLQQVKVVSRSFVFTFAVAGALALLACLCLYLHAQFVKRSERELRSRDAELYERDIRFKAAVENMPHGLVVFDNEQKVVICNRTFAKMYGLRLGQSGPGTPLRSILEHRQDIGTNPTNIANFIETRLAQVAEQRAAYTLHDLSDGRVVAVHDQPMPGGGLMAIHEDVTERRKAELRIAHLAHHDALTGLPNRVRFREELNKALMQADAGRLAVLCLDLDNFKSINDTLGHPVGDELLIAVAERLTGSLSDNDVIARLGGDEFAIVLVEGGELERSAAVSQRIIDALNAPFELSGHQVVVQTSIGIALAPSDSGDPDRLLKLADMALYRSKADGRGTYRFFEEEMDAKMQARRMLELDLRAAFINQELEVHYQPLVAVESSKISGFEALVRWQHPERGWVSPSDFIPLAEEIGLIAQIGAWVLKQACSEAVTWPSDMRVAVNVSSTEFKSQSFFSNVTSALQMAGLPGHRLELEITETVVLQDTEATLATLLQLRALGVRISMDDFGTGYSSLSYLRKFPFDKIKIDQSFIADLPDRDGSVAIIKAIAGMSHSLGMNTTAEGVETMEQFEAVRLQGCTEVQGFFFSPAVPAYKIAELIASSGDKDRVAA